MGLAEKKVRAEPVALRQAWICGADPLPLRRPCTLAGVCRATYDGQQPPRPADEAETLLLRLLDAEYTRHPFVGSRRRVPLLRQRGWVVNRQRVQRLMPRLGWAGRVPGPHTRRPHPEHRVYPSLLRGVAITQPHQAWSTAITDLRLARGWGYRVAMIDWYSRKVLTWRLSNTLEVGFCIDRLQEALHRFDTPEIFNTDQGSQFTSQAFIAILKAHPIRISRDGRGRAADNIFVERLWRTVKYEDIYLRDYETLAQVQAGLKTYFTFYHGERRHPSLGYQTPDQVYLTGQGGGARIIDNRDRPSASAPPLEDAAPR